MLEEVEVWPIVFATSSQIPILTENKEEELFQNVSFHEVIHYQVHFI